MLASQTKGNIQDHQEIGSWFPPGSEMDSIKPARFARRVDPAPTRYEQFCSRLLIAFVVTYIFWAAFSFVNFSFFAPLAIPFLLLICAKFYLKFSAFLVRPVLNAALAAVVTGVLAGVLIRRSSNVKYAAFLVSFLMNAMFLTAFLVSAERAKTAVITEAMIGRNHDCFYVRSFFNSLKIAGQEHAMGSHATYTQNGRMYHWSFKQMGFFEGQNSYPENSKCNRRQF